MDMIVRGTWSKQDALASLNANNMHERIAKSAMHCREGNHVISDKNNIATENPPCGFGVPILHRDGESPLIFFMSLSF
jgi:hypothetical protein